MQLALDSQNSPVDDAGAPPTASRRLGRRGATSMEYCVMASFILLVVIAAVQTFGVAVGNLFTSNAAATTQISQQNNNGP